MIISGEDLKKIPRGCCDLCGKQFIVGQSYEKITTHRKSKLIVHTDCIKKGI